MPSKRLIENTRLKTPINIPSGQLLQRPLTHLVLSFRLLLCLLQHPLVCWNTLPISTTLSSLTSLPPAPNSSQPAPPATRQSCASSTPTFSHSPERAPRAARPRAAHACVPQPHRRPPSRQAYTDYSLTHTPADISRSAPCGFCTAHSALWLTTLPSALQPLSRERRGRRGRGSRSPTAGSGRRGTRYRRGAYGLRPPRGSTCRLPGRRLRVRQGFVELVLRRSLEVRRMLARSWAEGEGWGAVVSLLLLSASAASRWDV